MNELFLKILSMSISAGFLVPVVLLARLLLRKAPKWINVLLWGIVAVRLVCPILVESPLSLVHQSVGSGSLVEQWQDDYVGNIVVFHDNTSEYDAGLAAGRQPVPAGDGHSYVVTGPDRLNEPATVGSTIVPVMTAVWITGIALLTAYTAVSFFRLRRKVGTAVLLRDNIFQSEAVISPFVLGTLQPKIYLPFALDEKALEHVVAHEQAHIRRKDHWWKPLGFLLLTIHWFNPLMWLSFVLLCRDIELACDEKVIRELGNEQRADYSQALVACSVRSPVISACPLAFGEVGVMQRVKAILRYRKPGSWIVLLAVIACGAVAVCFLTNPKQDRFRIGIVIPAGSQAEFVYANEEISPTKSPIILSAGDHLDDTEVVLTRVPGSEALSQPQYLTPGMPLRLSAEKGSWYRIGVNVQNPTEQDITVFLDVRNVQVRIPSRAEPDVVK